MWVLYLYETKGVDGIKIVPDIESAKEWLRNNVDGPISVYECDTSYYIQHGTQEIGIIGKAEII